MINGCREWIRGDEVCEVVGDGGSLNVIYVTHSLTDKRIFWSVCVFVSVSLLWLSLLAYGFSLRAGSFRRFWAGMWQHKQNKTIMGNRHRPDDRAEKKLKENTDARRSHAHPNRNSTHCFIFVFL